MVVTLTTDFGTRDGYVGEVKGVVLVGAPEVTLVDITHEVPPGDIRAGSWVLARIWSRFPARTVHLVVVDPGVGSTRKAVAVEVEERWFVGPDNGLLTRILEGSVPRAEPPRTPLRAHELDPEREVFGPLSDTFHGRDLFAPSAAWLAAGGEPSHLGPEMDPGELLRHEAPGPRRTGRGAAGEVVHVDRFGNLISNIPAGWLPERPRVRVGAIEVTRLGRSFAEVDPGSPVLIRGSAGTLEVCVRDGRADERLSAARGTVVDVAGEAPPGESPGTGG